VIFVNTIALCLEREGLHAEPSSRHRNVCQMWIQNGLFVHVGHEVNCEKMSLVGHGYEYDS
jgi:hypothetical protein